MQRLSISLFAALAVTLVLFVASASAQGMLEIVPEDESACSGGPAVPLVKGLYGIDFPITTSNSNARKYFEQGLILMYGFDHADAEKSFIEAAGLDPTCAMCYWGAAFVLGPNINAPMEDSAVEKAYKYAQKAVELSGSVTEKERMLIGAVAARYAPAPVEDRSALDRAFADGMAKVAARYPGDPDVGVMYAESLMDLHPWDYWDADGNPRPWTPQIVSLLDSIMKEHPRHPHANHLYIHLYENSATPEKTISSADVIVGLVPASGHLVHMAAHGYLASGLYHECSKANEEAIKVDTMLEKAFGGEGFYYQAYVPHVRHFLLACYTDEGRSADALRTADELAAQVKDSLRAYPQDATLQHFMIFRYYTLVRFGKWDEMLSEPSPGDEMLYAAGAWHYARGFALARKGEFKASEAELAALRDIASGDGIKDMSVWGINPAADLLAVSVETLAGELAAARGMYDEAVSHLQKAVDLQDSLLFDEPPPWYFPVRQSLGAVLLAAGRAADAEEVYLKDLIRNPETGWSLYGLAVSLRAQGKEGLARDAGMRLKRAWARADVELKASRY